MARPRNYRAKERREGAQARAREREQRTHEQQLARLDQLLGPGIGAKRERSRLQSATEK